MALVNPPNTKIYAKGTVIVREGELGNEMYILLSGNAGVFKNYQRDGEALTATLGPNDFFGEMSLFMGKSRDATIVALSDVTAIVMDRRNAPEVFAKQAGVMYNVMGTMCKSIDDLTAIRDRLNAELYGDASSNILSKNSALFPKGHGSYNLPITTEENEFLYLQKCSCPLCGRTFENLTVLTSRLRREGTDKDLRIRYVGIEPMYYDIISCPDCLFSAPVDLFPTTSKRFGDPVNREISKYKLDVHIKTGLQRDTFTVFAGYYLAMSCVPLCFDEYQLILAGMWQKLSRLYKDCEDEKMYLFATENALREYEYVYGHFRVNERQIQQICYIIGDLLERMKEYDRARNFFFLAKSNRAGTRAMMMEADKRLDDIKEIIQRLAK